MRAAVESRLDREAEALISYLTRPVLVHPDRLIEPLSEEVQRHRSASRGAIRARLATGAAEVAAIDATLRALSPQSTLDRGYAVVRDAAGSILRDASSVEVGSRIGVRLSHGSVVADVAETSE